MSAPALIFFAQKTSYIPVLFTLIAAFMILFYNVYIVNILKDAIHMPRNIGYQNQFENCFYTTYGRQASEVYNENLYCKEGCQYNTRRNTLVNDCKCSDWYRCKNLLKHGGGEPKPTKPERCRRR